MILSGFVDDTLVPSEEDAGRLIELALRGESTRLCGLEHGAIEVALRRAPALDTVETCKAFVLKQHDGDLRRSLCARIVVAGPRADEWLLHDLISENDPEVVYQILPALAADRQLVSDAMPVVAALWYRSRNRHVRLAAAQFLLKNADVLPHLASVLLSAGTECDPTYRARLDSSTQNSVDTMCAALRAAARDNH